VAQTRSQVLQAPLALQPRMRKIKGHSIGSKADDTLHAFISMPLCMVVNA